MDYARDLITGKVVAAEDASSMRSYECPRPGCGGRVYLPDVVVQRPHFRHYPNEGTRACDEYHPGIGGGGDGDGDGDARVVAAVEEEPSELGLLLTHVDGRWGLGLRLPEVPGAELGDTSLGALRSAFVDVYAGSDRVVRVSALELRPGVGTARVDLVPSMQVIRTQPSGTWPPPIDKDRWRLASRGLEGKGVLFRLRRGEWTRLVAGSGVHYGESLLLLADERCAPPESVVLGTSSHLPGGAGTWAVSEVRLPSELVPEVVSWLARLGHVLVARPWSVELAAPPRAYGTRGEPVFWVGDTPVLTLDAPRPEANALVVLHSGTNTHGVSICAAQGASAHVSVGLNDLTITGLSVASERAARLDLSVVPRPPSARIDALLAQTARLRIHIGQEVLEGWKGSHHKIRLAASQQPDVRVELGDETARACVTVWQRGKRCSMRGLDSGGVGRALEDALASAERIEVEAGNLGRLVILPVRLAVDGARGGKPQDRLAWREHVMSSSSPTPERSMVALLVQPRTNASLAARHVDRAMLVRARMALRRRLGVGGLGS